MNNHQRISETVTGVGCYAVLSCFSHVRLLVAPWTAACQASLSFTNSWSLLRVMSIELVMLSNHLILCCPFSSCPQSLSASGSFPMSGLFASGVQTIGASASVLPMNIQSLFPLGLTGLISLLSKDSQESSSAPRGLVKMQVLGPLPGISRLFRLLTDLMCY